MWEELMDLARKQAVSGIIIDGILTLPPECLPSYSLKLKIIQLLVQIEQENQRLNGEAVQVSEYLQTEGYTGIILKGQGAYSGGYPFSISGNIRSFLRRYPIFRSNRIRIPSG